MPSNHVSKTTKSACIWWYITVLNKLLQNCQFFLQFSKKFSILAKIPKHTFAGGFNLSTVGGYKWGIRTKTSAYFVFPFAYTHYELPYIMTTDWIAEQHSNFHMCSPPRIIPNFSPLKTPIFRRICSGSITLNDRNLWTQWSISDFVIVRNFLRFQILKNCNRSPKMSPRCSKTKNLNLKLKSTVNNPILYPAHTKPGRKPFISALY